MFKDNVSNLLNAKYEEDTRLEQLNDAYNDHIRNQQQLIEYLETRPLLDEWSQHSFNRSSAFAPASRDKLKSSTEKVSGSVLPQSVLGLKNDRDQDPID